MLRQAVRSARVVRPMTRRIHGIRPLAIRSETAGSGSTPADASGAPPPTTITFQQGARAATTGGIWVAIAGLVGVCGFYIAREIMPTSMSPNSVFNAAFEEIRKKPEVISRIGDNLKAYGGDYSRRKEGRRNFVEHQVYRDLDGVKRIRVQFNVEGSRGKAVVYAEKSENDDSNEFSYLIFDYRQQGHRETLALVDNRPTYTPGQIQEKVVERLNKSGAVLYGHSSCQWTQRQLLEFGEYADKLNVLLCDKDENKVQCEKAKLPGYPSWVIKNEQVPSFRSLEELRNLVQFQLA